MSTSVQAYFLIGNDEFAIANRIAEFHKIFTDPTGAEMNTIRLDGRTASDNDLSNGINAIPFLAAQRLVIFENPTAKYTKADVRGKFFDLVSKMPATTLLVAADFIADKRGLDKHWLFKWAEKNKDKVALETYLMPSTREMPRWINQEAKKQGGQIEPAGAARLADMVGANTRRAAQEIGKLLAYTDYSRPITLKDVELVSIVSAEGDIFALVDSMALGNGREAQAMYHRLLEEQDAFALFGMIVRQFRLLIQARECLDHGGNHNHVQKALGLHPFVAEKTTRQAQRFSMSTLEAIYRRLLEIDESAKTGQMTLDLALDIFLVQVSSIR